ncbi:response regulator transcription factor [Arcobacter sp. CECT 8985]|uniref:response regulator transcription factor n=1 Tax=Arcobacter sp. CECT 8985 TaxID=1935424 RepID=UPI00100A2A64|nr:response regulator [Arcobacter sp. CECT 8985]RXJ87546.1 response regulator [Arcobacter sp. CECT 8985]
MNSKINLELMEDLTVLYVEDEKDIRDNLEKCFLSIFKKCIVAKDGKDGVQTYMKHQKEIDIIITDLNMPYIDGIEMIKQIKAINPKISFIITTAYSDKQYLIDSINYGVNHYILKPFKIESLLKEVEKSYLSTHFVKKLKQQSEQIESLSKVFNSTKDDLMKENDKELNSKLVLIDEIIQLLDRR